MHLHLRRHARFRSLLCAAIAGASSFAQPTLEAQVWTVRSRYLAPAEIPFLNHQFGSAVGIGDLDGDGIGDLVVGERYFLNPENPGYNGKVHFYRGTSNGTLISAGSHESAEKEYHLGSSIAVGDFDGDGDLEAAVGAPGADQGAVQRVGEVWIFDWQEGAAELIDVLAPLDFGDTEALGSDGFGWAATAGDFDGDGFDDLAVAAPWRFFATTAYAGRVYVRYGSASGLGAAGQQMFFADDLRAGTSMMSNVFGFALAAGDFDGDDIADLAASAPGRTVGGKGAAGQVHILYGSDTGLSAEGNQLLDELSAGDALDHEEEFGFALAAGDFDGPGTASCEEGACADDLAVGVPGQDVLRGETLQPSGGAVRVFTGDGTAGGLDDTSALSLLQDDLASTAAQDLDRFGSELAAGRLDEPPPGEIDYADLAIGVPDEDLVAAFDAGVVHLVFGGADGLATASAQSWHAGPGLGANPPASEQHFGGSLALGDLDGDGWGDVAAGLPGRDRASGVQVMFGALFADGFEPSLCAWTLPGCP